ncbi:MAG: dihydroorotate dehydrogenase-like protein [Bacteroidota bacterium]
MANLSIKYMGIELKNPLIVGACNLVTDIKNLKKIEEAGAAAVVYKSLFEEQIQLEGLELENDIAEYTERNAEMVNLFPDIKHAGPVEYLMHLAAAKKSLTIPVIASLNAVYQDSWIEYAQKIEETGVDGIELNFYSVPKSLDITAAQIEDEQVEILKAVKAAVKIPVSVKLSPYYSNPLNIVSKMDKAGAGAFVLFNRLFQPDIDIEKLEQHFPYNLSNVEDNKLAMHFAGLLFGEVKGTICSNTGIFTGEDMIKMILCGADSVQVVSTLYKNHVTQITTMLDELNAWMDKKGYKTIADFKGKLSKKNSKDPFAYKRAQYVDIMMKSNSIFKKFPIV